MDKAASPAAYTGFFRFSPKLGAGVRSGIRKVAFSVSKDTRLAAASQLGKKPALQKDRHNEREERVKEKRKKSLRVSTYET